MGRGGVNAVFPLLFAYRDQWCRTELSPSVPVAVLVPASPSLPVPRSRCLLAAAYRYGVTPQANAVQPFAVRLQSLTIPVASIPRPGRPYRFTRAPVPLYVRPLRTLAAYDPATDTWSRAFQPLPSAVHMVHAQLVTRRGQQAGGEARTTLLVVGGEAAAMEDGIAVAQVGSGLRLLVGTRGAG